MLGVASKQLENVENFIDTYIHKFEIRRSFDAKSCKIERSQGLGTLLPIVFFMILVRSCKRPSKVRSKACFDRLFSLSDGRPLYRVASYHGEQRNK